MNSMSCLRAFILVGVASAFQSPASPRVSLSRHPTDAFTTTNSRQSRSSTARFLIEIDKVSDRSIAEGIFGTLMLNNDKATPVERFFHAWNRQDMTTAIAQFDEDCVYEDGTFYTPFEGKREIQRELLLRQDATSEPVLYVVDELAVSNDKVGVKYHLEMEGNILPNSRHCAFYTINASTGLIQTCYDVVEPAQKSGEANLAVLSAASKIIGKGDKGSAAGEESSSTLAVSTNTNEKEDGGWWTSIFKGSSTAEQGSSTLSLPEQYFDGEPFPLTACL